MSVRRLPSILFVCSLFTLAPEVEAAVTVSQSGDASIVRDETAGTWTLAAGRTTVTLQLDPARNFVVSALSAGGGASWLTAEQSDSMVTVGSRTLALGSRGAGFVLRDVSVATNDRRLQLNATFDLAASSLRVVRHYAVVPGSPTFEAWSTYESLGDAPVISQLNLLRMQLTNGAVRSLTGLRGDSADVQSESVFTLEKQDLEKSERFSIGAKGRSSESSVPWIAIDGQGEVFYAALMWSGSWTITADRQDSSLSLQIGLPTTTTTVRGKVDGPHVLFGAVKGDVGEATAALRSYALDGIRNGRPLEAPVTYNTWFAYGIAIDEVSVRAEMARVAGLGVELFVVDAGWYEGPGAADPSDFEAGLGSWVADPARFPDGLRPLRDYAHQLGMKFGIWVEPERVNRSVVGAPGPEEAWLASVNGQYGSERTAQICLSHSAARRWILEQVSQLIDEVGPDYLKWDNNFWVNCDRGGHGHESADGNFAHVNALYDVLATLRERYPGLLIENVSGGGNRLDLGMLRFTDVAWMDDRTAPSVNVRHNIEGLSAVFPPAYLLSFVTEHADEPLHDAPDLLLYVRSRMAGALGLCFRTDTFSETELASLARETATYKATRDALSIASASLLTDQVTRIEGPPWDVLQSTTAGRDRALITAFQTNRGVATINVKPVALQADVVYQVQSVDSGVLGEATGASLMTNGIDILGSPHSAAHILIIRARN